jgi:hypothetical protein
LERIAKKKKNASSKWSAKPGFSSVCEDALSYPTDSDTCKEHNPELGTWEEFNKR